MPYVYLMPIYLNKAKHNCISICCLVALTTCNNCPTEIQKFQRSTRCWFLAAFFQQVLSPQIWHHKQSMAQLSHWILLKIAVESCHVIGMRWYLSYDTKPRNDVHVLEIGRADLAFIVINTKFDAYYDLPYMWNATSLTILAFFLGKYVGFVVFWWHFGDFLANPLSRLWLKKWHVILQCNH